jgi:polygalacturonase
MSPVLILLPALALSLAVPACLADVPAKTFDVRALGAKGDGTTDDTAAIQKALDACKGTGGTVEFPAGKYWSGPLTLRTKTTVLLDSGATLLASTNQAIYLKEGKGTDWLAANSSGDFNPFISGSKLQDIAFTGQGTIDGNGYAWWDEAEKARQKKAGYTLPRPNLIQLERCHNVRLSGITLANSMKFHFVPNECTNVTIENITITAPEHAANTDGIDPGNCDTVNITHCTFDTGDDDIAIKSTRKVKNREFGCENITVTDCTFKHGHGMSIGSETVGGVHKLLVKNCTFEDTDNGLRIKSRREKGGIVDDITYSGCTMTNCHPCISIVTYYQDSTRATFQDDPGQPMTNTTPVFRNIHFVNITGSSTVDAGLIVGLPESCVSNVTFDNVHFTAAQGGLVFANVKGVQFNNSDITATTGPGVVIKKNADVQGLPTVK